ncbi:MAG: HlyD family secretion protein [Candidatus Syntropharchaeia archaeon]
MKKVIFIPFLMIFLFTSIVGAGFIEKVEEIKVPPKGEMIKVNETVPIALNLTGLTPAINTSELILSTELKDPKWSIDLGTESKASNRKEFSVMVDHRKANYVSINLMGIAPKVSGRVDIELINITQRVGNETYPIYHLERSVTSEAIEKALSAIYEARDWVKLANETISNATAMGASVEEAKLSLETAKLSLENAEEFYGKGQSNESIIAAENATYYAKIAYEKAKGEINSINMRNYGIISGIIVILGVIGVIAYKKRRWDKL